MNFVRAARWRRHSICPVIAAAIRQDREAMIANLENKARQSVAEFHK